MALDDRGPCHCCNVFNAPGIAKLLPSEMDEAPRSFDAQSVHNFFNAMGAREQTAADKTSRSLTPPGPPLDSLKVSVRESIISQRIAAETGGVLAGGMVHETSEAALRRLALLLAFALYDKEYTARVQARDGSVVTLTATQLFQLGAAVANHVQTCALWERDLLADLARAEGSEEVDRVAGRVASSFPAGDTSTPQPPEGGSGPSESASSVPDHIECLSVDAAESLTSRAALVVEGISTLAGAVSTQGTLKVNGDTSLAAKLDVARVSTFQTTVDVKDLTITERLYARDRMATQSMYVDRGVRAFTSTVAVAGQFLWRLGDRPPTSVTVQYQCSTPVTQPGFQLFEPGRNRALGYVIASPGAMNTDLVATLSVNSNAQHAPRSDEVYILEVQIANMNTRGVVTLGNYLVNRA